MFILKMSHSKKLDSTVEYIYNYICFASFMIVGFTLPKKNVLYFITQSCEGFSSSEKKKKQNI